MQMKTRTRWMLLGVFLAAVVAVAAVRSFCITTWWRTGLLIHRCPDGELVQHVAVRADGLRRDAWGPVTIEAKAVYTIGDAERTLEATIGSFTATLALVDAAGKETPLAPDSQGWQSAGPGKTAIVKLPAVPDGDYKLRAHVVSRVGDSTVDVPLALYAPARVHVITDRPLYQPGQTVQFSAIVLRAQGLAPLDGRPGHWMVKDPSGDVLLEERAPAGPWGVAAGSFPLDKGAANGVWHVAWVSADATEEIPFTVEPFTLPRFRVEAAADRRFYRPGDSPRIHGAALYSSGAPVAAAAVAVTWTVRGDWPMPTEWTEEGALPRTATTGPSGRFELALPPIPADLQGQASLVARLAVVDAAGDRVEGRAEALLAQDGLAVAAVTELGDGLAEGFNNRVYLRVATPDGRVLSGATIHVKRAWAPKDPGIEAKLDEDGVASLQLDPGPAVNVVVPPRPFRMPPRPKPVLPGEVRELLAGGGASLEDQLAIEGWLPALAPCARWVSGGSVALPVGLRVAENGTLAQVAIAPGPLHACVAERLASKRLPPGAARVYAASFTFNDPETPRLVVAFEPVLPDATGLEARLALRALDARDCLTAATPEGPLPRALGYRVRAGKKEIELAWLRDPNGVAAPAETDCLARRVGTLALDEPAEADGLGVARFAVSLPDRIKASRPQATTLLGYEFLVSAAVDGAPATKLRLGPGTVPPLRLRATPILAERGQTVTVELIRGPGYAGELPATVALVPAETPLAFNVDRESRTAKVELGASEPGWYEIVAGAARARIFVRSHDDLAVNVTPGRERYAPGDTATLAIATTTGGRPGPAAVGLFGVDESMAQLAPLPGPDDLGRLRPAVTMSSPAFDVLDGTALALGRIRGANAAAATVLRVATLPSAADLDTTVNGAGATPFDPSAVLIDRFYTVLAELHTQVRRWETEAPADEKMHPPTLAKLWQSALEACAKRGEPVADAFGRPLKLRRLPADLLAQTEPRLLVATGTRLPEDIESWPAWVARENP